MAVKSTQGVKAYLVAVGVDLTDAADIATAITTAKEIDCMVELGDLSLGTRTVTEKTCINKAGTAKFLGSYSIGNIAPELIYDAADTAGQAELIAMWEDAERRQMIIAFPDQITPTTGNPTYFVFPAEISTAAIGMPKDDAISYKPTIEMMALPVLIKAT